MDVRAIILTGIPPESNNGLDAPYAESQETFAGVPFSLMPALGRPLLHRLADRLYKSGIDSISVVNAADPSVSLIAEACRSDLRWKNVSADQIWRAAENEFNEAVQAGAELVVVIRMGAYAEVEIDPLLQFHLDQRNNTTQVTAPDGPLEFFVLSSSRRSDAAFLLRSQFRKMRTPAKPFITGGYMNRLRTPADLRRLILDSFALKTALQPLGDQVRPGIWIGKGAKFGRSVRLVAPCYIGEYSRIRAGSLITRGSSLEHHSVVDCGSIVEASSLLPLSYIGPGLDLMYSVVGFKRIASVKYGTTLEVDDGALISSVSAVSAVRALSDAINLIAFLPRQIVRSFVGGRSLRPSQVNPECPPANFDPAAVTKTAVQDRQTLTPSVVAGMREYGNQ